MILQLWFLLACFSYMSFATEDSVSYYENLIETVNKRQTIWKAGHNFDVNILKSIGRKFGGSLPEVEDIQAYSSVDEEHIHNHFGRKNKKLCSSAKDSFDGRVEWSICPTVAHIWDEGNCASDWAIGPVSAIADRICLATKGKYQMPISPQKVLSCCKGCGWGCKKGYASQTWKYWITHGLVTGGDYNDTTGCQPYTVPPCDHYVIGGLPACSENPATPSPCYYHCYNEQYGKSYRDDTVRGVNLTRIQCPCCVRYNIQKYGPVSATFLLYEDFLFYKSGIYEHIAGERIGSQTVKVVGWGVENGVNYWIAANSWNRHWGEGGFFRIRRFTNECMFERNFVSAVPIIDDVNN